MYINKGSFEKHNCQNITPNKKNEFLCLYCNTYFQSERTSFSHVCEAKRRYLDQDIKHVKLGFSIFNRFNELNRIGKKSKTYEDFVKSKFYSDFVTFGKYLLNMNAINPKDFVDFLIKNQIKIGKWKSNVVYETYIRELNKRESPDAAIERTLLLMEQWANDTGKLLTDFFREISPVLATQWIQSGRISPWLLFASSSGSDMLRRLSEEQQSLVWQNIDPAFWEQKILRAGNDIDIIRETLDTVGL